MTFYFNPIKNNVLNIESIIKASEFLAERNRWNCIHMNEWLMFNLDVEWSLLLTILNL